MNHKTRFVDSTLIKRLSRFRRLPLKYKFIAVEAFILTGLVRFSILFIPFRRVASAMGVPMRETSEEIDPKLLATARQVAWFVRKMSCFTFWESKCLVQALSAQIMLKNRKIPSTLYLGMAKDKTNKLSAHAWLRCGSCILTGEYERSGFTTVAYFSVDSSNK